MEKLLNEIKNSSSNKEVNIPISLNKPSLFVQSKNFS